MRSQHFSKKLRICKTAEFKKILQQGKKISTKSLMIYYLPNRLDYSRLGISISKSAGGAVARNLRKRWIREVFRTSPFIRGRGFDILVLMRNGFNEIDFQSIQEQFKGAMEKLR